MSNESASTAKGIIVRRANGRDRKTANLQGPSDPLAHDFQTLLRADFSDVDALCSAVRGWNLDFRPLAKSAMRTSVGRLVQSRGAGVHFGSASFSLTLDQRGTPPPGCVTFVVLGDSVRRLWWRGRDVDSATVLVFPIGGELHSISGSDFAVHTISIELPLVEEICEGLGLTLRPAHGLLEVFTPAPAILSTLRSALRLVADRGACPTAAATRSIAEALIKAWDEAHGGAFRTTSSSATDRTMRKVLERLDHADWPSLTATDLCSHASVSERTLQTAFRARFGTTPAAFLKARRLSAVNAALKSADGEGVSVGDIAAQYGFWHSGQFATDYKRAFGELPSETVHRPRAPNARRG